MYQFILTVIYRLGFKKTAVGIADRWHDDFVNNKVLSDNRRYQAASYFSYFTQTIYPECEVCHWHITPSKPHFECDQELRHIAEEADREAWEWYRAEQAREEAEWLQFVEDEEAKMEQQRLEDEAWIDDVDDDYDERDNDICDGICGQPAYACTCAETESFRQHQSDPATAGSWWVA